MFLRVIFFFILIAAVIEYLKRDNLKNINFLIKCTGNIGFRRCPPLVTYTAECSNNDKILIHGDERCIVPLTNNEKIHCINGFLLSENNTICIEKK